MTKEIYDPENLTGLLTCNERLSPIFCEIAILADRQKDYASTAPEYGELEKHLLSLRTKAERIFRLYHPELKGERKNAKKENETVGTGGDPGGNEVSHE